MQLDCRRSEVLVGSTPHQLLVISSHILSDSIWKAQLGKNPPAMQETWGQCLGQENPLEKGMVTHSTILD